MQSVMFLFFSLLFTCFGSAAPKKIRVFVALCDNESQGIVKVGRVIGDGDKPDANLYWGCSDGLPKVFGKSAKWTKGEVKKALSDDVLREVLFTHKVSKSTLVASAYKGTSMKQCFIDYEKAVASGEFDFVCYIGHNALMDMVAADGVVAKKTTKTQVAVLCCLSDRYFSDRITKAGAKPVLMTRSLMYPGSFLLHDGLEVWLKGGGVKEIRAAAGKAYHKNQVKQNPRLSVKNATGVFADLEK